MLINIQPASNCRNEARFWLLWGLATSLGAVAGIASGYVVALLVGVASYLLAAVIPWLKPFALIPPMAAVGTMIGIVVGSAQSVVLPWPRVAREQWLLRSVYGWTLGAGLGSLLAIVIELLLKGDVNALTNSAGSTMMVIMTPVLGLVLAIMQRPALLAPAPHLALWLAANVAATSLGWIIARPFVDASSLVGLSWAGVVLGPLVYAMISGAMMVWIERRRVAAEDVAC